MLATALRHGLPIATRVVTMREHAQQRRAADAPALQTAAEWLPYYREMYLKAAGRNIGMQRWASGAQ